MQDSELKGSFIFAGFRSGTHHHKSGISLPFALRWWGEAIPKSEDHPSASFRQSGASFSAVAPAILATTIIIIIVTRFHLGGKTSIFIIYN
jgi:hypothetical protein